MKKLIIAEKPSLARNIIAAIGSSSFKKHDNYYENENFIVTWAFGHLFGLIDIEEYSPLYNPDEKSSWTLDGLPFIPEAFCFSLKKDRKTKMIDAGVQKQFNTINSLIYRNDVDAIVNAGDSDREGEIIIRIILENAYNKKPVERLWMPDQTPETIRDELRAVRPDSEYDMLANEGYARTYIDWLYGINLTRYATLKAGKLLRVGRVTSPIINAIYDRDMAIKNFVPEKYLSIESKEQTNGELIELVSKQEFKDNEFSSAQELCDKYNAAETRVVDVKSEKKTIFPGRLYSLSKLQGVLGRLYKMSPQAALNITQKLYEEGYVTYPRTNTEYLATAEKGKINNIVKVIKEQGYPVVFKDNKSIFDDSKIESHSALTPTTKIPKAGVLSGEEQKVYDIILKRFVAVFCAENCVVNRSTICIDNGYEEFELKGDVVLEKGWLQYDINDKKDKVLPKLAVGDIVAVKFNPMNKETVPPKHYTVDSFNKFLKNPFKDELKSDEEHDEDAEDDYKAIMSGAELGTEATRAGLIDAAIKSEYISLKNNSYYITDLGIYYVETLKKLFINMSKEKTVQLGMTLKKVYTGNITISDSINITAKEIQEVFAHQADVDLERFIAENETICICPKCGAAIKDTPKAYACSNDKCGITIFKEDKFFAHFGKKVPPTLAKILFLKGQVNAKGLTSAKTGKKFNALIRVTFEDKFPKYEMEFEAPSHEEIGVCPKCGDKIIDKGKAYGCETCEFVMWKEDRFLASMGKKLTPTIAKQLLSQKCAYIKGLKSKRTGKTFNAMIRVDYSGNTPKYDLDFSNS